MPELPDVEIYKRYLESTSLHQEIQRTVVRDERLLKGTSPETLQKRAKGKSLNATRRHGKYLFVSLDPSSAWVVFHFGMTGDLKYTQGHSDEDYARVIFEFTNGHRLLFRDSRRLGAVIPVDDPESFIAQKKLGPDALAIEKADFDQMLSKSRGALKPLFMDQSAIAGIGNLYTDEILFQSHLHPGIRADKLEAEERTRLYENMKSVLRTAIEKNADPKQFPESYLIPRRRTKLSCPRCGTKIERLPFEGRSAYFCPQCQKNQNEE